MRAVVSDGKVRMYICDPSPRLCENARWLCSNPGPWPLANLPVQFWLLLGYPLAGRIVRSESPSVERGREQNNVFMVSDVDGQIDPNNSNLAITILREIRPNYVCSGFGDCSFVDLRLGLTRACTGPGSSTRVIGGRGRSFH